MSLKLIIRKLNNSYESEPSSGSGGSSLSEHHECAISDDENMHVQYILKPPSYQSEVTVTTSHHGDDSEHYHTGATNMAKKDRDFRYGITLDSSQESSFEGFSDVSAEKPKPMLKDSERENSQTEANNNVNSIVLEEKPKQDPSPSKSLKFYDFVVEEDSCNAVDVLLSNEHAESQACSGSNYSNEPSSQLSFNGRIKSMTYKSTCTLENVAPLHQPLTIAAQRLPTLLEATLNGSQLNETSFVYTNEKSPDLFGDYDDDGVYVVEDSIIDEEQPIMFTYEDETDEAPEEVLQHESSINKSLNCPTESSYADDQTLEDSTQTSMSDSQYLFLANCKREKELLRRIRKCLDGVPPPPTVTIPQLDLIATVLKHKDSILNFNKNVLLSESINSSYTAGSLLKPTHSLEEMQSMTWKDILGVRQHGLSFNLGKASENSEYLSLSVIDRFVGAETASSYQISPSSAKKRNARLKMLTASPGNRLSHLAKRRAVFSSANLATTSMKSTTSLGTQIQLDKKKHRNRRKGTPKRKTPGSKKKNVRKTPSSSARKRLYRCDIIKPGPSRENSKRALFQSPAKTLFPKRYGLPKPIIKPEIATRVEKSKRALFSPEKLSQCSTQSSFNAYSGGDSSQSNHAFFNSTSLALNSSTQQLETLLLKRKRHNAEDDDANDAAVLAEAQNSKIFRGSAQCLTPRALKIKSQSFCIGAGSSSKSKNKNNSSICWAAPASTSLSSSGNLHRGLNNSQILMQSRSSSSLSSIESGKLLRAQSENATMLSNSLTENQRKKLLWAVSQALQEKKITAKHESFKEYASVLARVVRRIFQEYYQKSSASNSETMLRLAKKYAYNVINGKNVDDIYFQARSQIDDNKRKSFSRLSGYIAPEDYEHRKVSQHQKLSESLSQQSLNVSTQNIFDGCLSQTSSFAPSATALSCTTVTSQTCMLDQSLAQTSQSDIPQDVPLNCFKNQQLPIQQNATLQNSSSKNNLYGLALRENIDCEQRRSAQKNFTGKDQRNVSPYTTNRVGSAVKIQPNVIHDLYAAKAKRQISFDS